MKKIKSLNEEISDPFVRDVLRGLVVRAEAGHQQDSFGMVRGKDRTAGCK